LRHDADGYRRIVRSPRVRDHFKRFRDDRVVPWWVEPYPSALDRVDHGSVLHREVRGFVPAVPATLRVSPSRVAKQIDLRAGVAPRPVEIPWYEFPIARRQPCFLQAQIVGNRVQFTLDVSSGRCVHRGVHQKLQNRSIRRVFGGAFVDRVTNLDVVAPHEYALVHVVVLPKLETAADGDELFPRNVEVGFFLCERGPTRTSGRQGLPVYSGRHRRPTKADAVKEEYETKERKKSVSHS